MTYIPGVTLANIHESLVLEVSLLQRDLHVGVLPSDEIP